MRMILESQIAFQTYKAGGLDWTGVAPEDLKEVQSDPTLKAEYQRVPGSCNFYLGLNVKKAPFDDIKVRQAFARGFDREDYVEVVLKGAGEPALSFIPPGRPGYEESVKQPEFDATEAKAMLDEATAGKALPEIKLTYSASARNKTRMEWVQNQMKTNLGIDAELESVERTAYTELLKNEETTPQMFFLGWCQDYPDPQDWLSLVFRSESTITHVGWKNEKFDELTKAADIETDQAKRLEMYKEAHALLAEEAPVVFLYWDVTDLLIKPYVQGMRDHITPDDALVPGIKNIQNIEVNRP
jgi:oligopeptide transport system substrate-binding protein